ncbi:hypothetical protein EV282_3745 [Fictibacillus sp. BK138]|nr:hypothetical protein EV282_3745 [Fictibacillus sp. BK138]
MLLLSVVLIILGVLSIVYSFKFDKKNLHGSTGEIMELIISVLPNMMGKIFFFCIGSFLIFMVVYSWLVERNIIE